MRLLVSFVVSVAGVAFNDVCQGAFPIHDGANTGNNIGALEQPSSSSCSIYHDVFYWYNATCTGTAIVTVTNASAGGPSYYLDASVYSGPCGWLGNPIRQGGSCSDTNLTWSVQQNTVSYLSIGTQTAGATGSFNIAVTCAPQALTPGDLCTTAIPVVGTTVATNVGATDDIYQRSRNLYASVWFKYNATCTGDATLILSTPDSVDFTSAAGFQYNDCARAPSGFYLDSDDSGSGGNESLTFPVVANEVFLIVGASYSSGRGNFRVDVSCSPVTRPSNDLCSGATVLVPGVSTPGNATDASRTLDDSCSTNPEVWYRTVPTCTGDLTVDFSGPAYGVRFKAGATCANLGAQSCPTAAPLTIPVVNGTEVWFAVVSNGEFNVTATCVPVVRPLYDSCVGAANITGAGSFWGNSANADTDVLDFGRKSLACGISDLYNNEWINYMPNCTGEITLSYDSNTTVNLAVYVGSCSSLIRVLCDSSAGTVKIPVTPGLPVYITVGSYYENYNGQYSVNITCNAIAYPSLAPTAAITSAPTAFVSQAPTVKGQTRAPTTRAPTIKGQTYAPTTGAPTTATTNAASHASVSFMAVAFVLAALA